MEIFTQLLINGLVGGAGLALFAMSFNFVYSPTKFINFAHGSVAVIGGYAVFYLRGLGVNVYAAIISGILLAGLTGWILNIIIYRPLRQKKASNMTVLIASLGAFLTIQSLLAIFFTSRFRSLLQDIDGQKLYQIGAGVITQTQIYIIISSVAILLGLLALLKFTLFGRTVRAISDDEEVAKIVGINTDRVLSWVFFIGSALAGLSGILVGFDRGINPTLDFTLLLFGVTAAIVGGMGSVLGGFVGGIFSGLVSHFGIWKIPGEWQGAIFFVVLILFLVFRPRGILNKSR